MHNISSSAAAKRLDYREALDLVRQTDVHTLAEMACAVRTRLYADRAYYVYNQHLNYTNICANQCLFCAFKKTATEADAFTLSIEQACKKLRQRSQAPVREVHVVGGLNPALPYSYYLDLLAALKKERPEACIKAFTAVEIAWLAERENLRWEQVLEDMMRAGLGALPGGGAEVFSPELRKKLCPEKLSGKTWLAVHRCAHALGLRSNCTLLFGHIESWEHRLEHLEALRSLQDETGGFVCFIPLQYQPGNNALEASGTGGLEYLKMVALSRLYLDNIAHIKAYWVFTGMKVAQMALHAGADDFDGTLVEEKIGHAAGATTPRGLTVEALRENIRQAGFEPVERDTLFRPVAG